MTFSVLIPARLASTRLPNKPLLDIGGMPMIVRVALQAMKSSATRTVVATDAPSIMAACAAFNIPTVFTKADHASGSDRLAEASDLLDLGDDEIVVNVQGDEPLIDPHLIDAVAHQLAQRTDCVMSSAAHPIADYEDFLNSNVVKVVLDSRQTALYFSRAPIPMCREGAPGAWWKSGSPASGPLRHIGIYAYRARFLKAFPQLPQSPAEQLESLEQLRVLWHGHRIAMHITKEAPGPGVDTPEDLDRVRAFISGSQAFQPAPEA